MCDRLLVGVADHELTAVSRRVVDAAASGVSYPCGCVVLCTVSFSCHVVMLRWSANRVCRWWVLRMRAYERGVCKAFLCCGPCVAHCNSATAALRVLCDFPSALRES